VFSSSTPLKSSCKNSNTELKPYRPIDANSEIHGFLNRIGYSTQNQNMLNKKETKYLTGDWFEDYVYNLVKKCYNLKDEEIGVGWQLQKGSNNTPNEFDILFIKDKKLNIIECKTSIFSSTVDNKNIITDTIYKVDALRNNLGLFAKTNIFTLSDLNKSDASIKSSIDRAKEFKITICGKADFQDENFPENIFKK
jgi:hypothetical protein